MVSDFVILQSIFAGRFKELHDATYFSEMKKQGEGMTIYTFKQKLMKVKIMSDLVKMYLYKGLC